MDCDCILCVVACFLCWGNMLSRTGYFIQEGEDSVGASRVGNK